MNGTSYDAHVIVVDSSSELRVRDIGVGPDSSFFMESFSPGNYRVVLATGTDWDDVKKVFTRHPQYFRFGKDLSFAESSDQRTIHYSRHTITLNPVVDGNVRAVSPTEAQFHAQMGMSAK